MLGRDQQDEGGLCSGRCKTRLKEALERGRGSLYTSTLNLKLRDVVVHHRSRRQWKASRRCRGESPALWIGQLFSVVFLAVWRFQTIQRTLHSDPFAAGRTAVNHTGATS